MEKDPAIVARLAREKEDENWRFRTYLKMTSRSATFINQLAARLGSEAEASMNCTTCGACCRANHVPLTQDEENRLASLMSLPVVEFHDRHMERDDEGEWTLNANPCPFLQGTRCGVYRDRPDACRGYPYIGGDVATLMVGIIERAGTCPIVFKMLEQLKAALGFDRYR